MQAAALSPELSLIRNCCSACFAAQPEPLRTPLAEVDWLTVLAISRRHRVQGLVFKALSRSGAAPDWVLEKLAGIARNTAALAMRFAAESLRLRNAFADQQLDVLFIKGLPLARVSYGDPFCKEAVDIDVLVDRSRVAEAAELLTDLGYKPVFPRKAELIARWHRRAKESVWLSSTGIQLDLHSQLLDNPTLFSFPDLIGRCTTIEVLPGLALPSLSGSQNVAYLAAHGASSAWFRLKWLSDFAALLFSINQEQLEYTYRAACRQVPGDAVPLAFGLSNHLFCTPLPSSYLATQELSRLEILTLKQLAAETEPTDRLLGTVGIHRLQILIARRGQDRRRSLGRQISQALLHRGF